MSVHYSASRVSNLLSSVPSGAGGRRLIRHPACPSSLHPGACPGGPRVLGCPGEAEEVGGSVTPMYGVTLSSCLPSSLSPLIFQPWPTPPSPAYGDVTGTCRWVAGCDKQDQGWGSRRCGLAALSPVASLLLSAGGSWKVSVGLQKGEWTLMAPFGMCVGLLRGSSRAGAAGWQLLVLKRWVHRTQRVP